MKREVRDLWADMIDVRQRYESGTPQVVIAEDYGVSSDTVARMLRRLGVEIRRGRTKRQRALLGEAARVYLRAKDREGTRRPVHRVCWETCRGEIPEGYVVHHIDGDVLNNTIENLACMSPEEHKRLHAHMRRVVRRRQRKPKGISPKRASDAKSDVCPMCGGSKETHGHTPDGKTHWTSPCPACCPHDGK